MELITILNHCHYFRGFVYFRARFTDDHKGIEVAVRPRRGTPAICSRCHQPAPGFDQLPERRFEFIPFWGFFVFLLYAMRRVDCRRCGAVLVEEVPWAGGKRTLTEAYMLFLARWRAGSPGRTPPPPFAPLGRRFSTPSNMSLPGAWNIVRSARSTPSAWTKSSTPRAISTSPWSTKSISACCGSAKNAPSNRFKDSSTLWDNRALPTFHPKSGGSAAAMP